MSMTNDELLAIKSRADEVGPGLLVLAGLRVSCRCATEDCK
jgi:hypothetical protein